MNPVMQEYDAKQVEANAKLAGFTDFVTTACDFTDASGKTLKTLMVSCVKPVKSGTEVEVVVEKHTVRPVVTITTKTKGGKTATVTTTATKTTGTTVRKVK